MRKAVLLAALSLVATTTAANAAGTTSSTGTSGNTDAALSAGAIKCKLMPFLKGCGSLGH